MDPKQKPQSPPAPSDPQRALIAGSFQLFQQDPLFRPHADFAFERKDVLGSGGMGVVYRAYDRRFRREAALKILQRAVATPLVIQRFVREARVTALLDHPAIPAVYEFGRNGRGEYFILMKLIRGRTLDELLTEAHKASASSIREPGTLAEKLTILIRVCDALTYAHERGVVHRDLKPENIMIGRHGEVYLMDWGLARDGRESPAEDETFRRNETEIQTSVFHNTISSQGSVVGTRGYLAPEQAAGETCDARADLYALGAVLFELMVGRRPIEAPGMAGIVAAMEGRLDIPDDFGKGFPPELAALVRRCLSREPAARPKDAEALGRALRKIRQSLRAANKPRPSRAAPLIIAALTLLCAGLGAALALRDPAPRAPAAGLVPPLAFEDEPLTHDKRPTPPQILARQARERDEPRRAFAILEAAITKDPDDPVLRHELGLLFLATGQKQEAQAQLDRAVSLDRSSAIYAKDRGRAFMRRFLFPDAFAEFSRAIDLDPELAEAHAYRGYCRYQLGEGAAALADFEKAIALDGARARFFRDRALVYEELGEVSRARADYDEAIALAPEDPRVFLDRGNFFLNNNQLEKAEADFTRSLEIKPDIGVTLYFRAQARRGLGRKAEALADLDQALSKEARSLEALIERADLRFETGDHRGALEDYRGALKLAPPNELTPGLNERVAELEKILAKE